MENHIERGVAKVATDTHEHSRKTSLRDGDTGEKGEIWALQKGWGLLVETQDNINLKVRGDHQSRRFFFSIWHLLGLSIQM